jgi:hypothetical protein
VQRGSGRPSCSTQRDRGWNDEAKRHAALVDRLDVIIAKTN